MKEEPQKKHDIFVYPFFVNIHAQKPPFWNIEKNMNYRKENLFLKNMKAPPSLMVANGLKWNEKKMENTEAWNTDVVFTYWQDILSLPGDAKKRNIGSTSE